jgi:hypothetical protein
MTDTQWIILLGLTNLATLFATYLATKHFTGPGQAQPQAKAPRAERTASPTLSHAGDAAQLTYQVSDRGERLWIINAGRGEARDITLLFDDLPVNEHPLYAPGAANHPTRLAADSEFAIPLAPGPGKPKTFKLTLQWTEGRNEPRIVDVNARLY